MVSRSGGGKARNERIHSYFLIPGRCHARSGFRAWRKGKNGPQLAVGILGSRNTRLFRGLFLGNIPNQAGGFSCAMLSDATRTLAVEWLPVPSSIKIADTVGNAVTFLRLALRQTTRTLFSSQGTVDIFSHRRPKVETARVETVRETRLTTAIESGMACGGFRFGQ